MSDSKAKTKKTRPRWMRRFLILLLLLVVGGLAVVPTILSSDTFINGLLGQVNSQLSGTVEVKAFSTSWTGTTHVEGLTLWTGKSGEGTPLLTIPKSDFSFSLPGILAGRYDVDASIDGFAADIILHQDGSTNIEEFLGLPPLKSKTHGPFKIPRIPIRVDIEMKNGQSVIHDKALGMDYGVEKLDMTAVSAAPNSLVEIDMSGELSMETSKAPFELHGKGLDPDDPTFEVHLTVDEFEPGPAIAPLLAVAFPLLANNSSGFLTQISAPVSWTLDIAGPDLDKVVAGKMDGLTGSIAVEIGAGDLSGGAWGAVQSVIGKPGPALGALSEIAQKTPLLAFHGFRGRLELTGEKAIVTEATLLHDDSGSSTLSVLGSFDLASQQFDYRIPWDSLLHHETAQKIVAGRTLSITGPLDTPRIDLDLDHLPKQILKVAVEEKIDKEVAKKKEALGAKADKAIDDKLDEVLGDKGSKGVREEAKKKVKSLLQGILSGNKDDGRLPPP
ncbi:MAG: hypothetical protein VX916_01730 [Planctomycetota bacterium]|nr:hypothetical protein [Planctomycetota bacterium]